MVHSSIADMKFETALAEFEAMVQSMKGGNLAREASATDRRDMTQMNLCQQQPVDAEHQVLILEDGELKDFNPADAR